MAKKTLGNDEDFQAHDAEDFVEVVLPSGAPYKVYVDEEDFFTARSTQYLSDNEFSNIADLQDVDRIIILELFIWRFGLWAMTQKNYWGEPVDDNQLQKSIKEYSGETRQIKSALGLDKVARDRQKGVDSPAQYLANLRARAMAFGYKREEEFQKMLELGQHLRAIVTLYENCDEDERREMRCRPEDIMEWIEHTFFREYDAIDQHFRQVGDPKIGPQRLWVKEM